VVGPEAPLVAGVADALRAAGVDTLVVDLQHAGARFYTYESSLYDAIAAGHETGVRIRVADRPNPLGGLAVDGPVLDPAYASFVGRAPIPQRHGLTMGELAGLFAELLGAPAPDVVPMDGWRREMLFAGTGLPWVPPSPNLPTPVTALVYAGTCLFEGTNMSVGRGTTTPFEIIGAPWLDRRLVDALRARDLPGAAFREADFTPAFDNHAGTRLRVIAVHVTDPIAFDPLRVAVTALTTIAALYPDQLEFRPSFDTLAGGPRLRTEIVSGATPAGIAAGWAADLIDFAEVRARHLRY